MRASDLDQVRQIAAASPEGPQWPADAYAAYLPDQPQTAICRTAFVAEADGMVLGFAAATLLRLPDQDGEENRCELDSVAVDPAARRRGIATALVRAMLDWAEKNGAFHFSLEVRASNSAAIALYRQLGLREEGRRLRYYADPEEDGLILGRAITVGPPNGEFPP